MKAIKKAALAAAIVATPVAGFAMEALEDEALSDVTGRDGIDINIGLNNASLNITYADTDGIQAAPLANSATITVGSYTNAGALLINNLGITSPTGGINIAIDVGGGSATHTGSGVLNALISTSATTTVSLPSNIQVADYNATGANGATAGTVGTGVTIVSFAAGATLNVGQFNLNAQLGAEPQGHFALFTGTLGDISLSNLTINDADSGGGLTLGQLSVSGLNLGDGIDINIDASDLVIHTAANALTSVSVGITDIQVGAGATQSTIGDVYISGLNMSNTTIRVSGH